jgi:hypothetical protein
MSNGFAVKFLTHELGFDSKSYTICFILWMTLIESYLKAIEIKKMMSCILDEDILC